MNVARLITDIYYGNYPSYLTDSVGNLSRYTNDLVPLSVAGSISQLKNYASRGFSNGFFRFEKGRWKEDKDKADELGCLYYFRRECKGIFEGDYIELLIYE